MHPADVSRILAEETSRKPDDAGREQRRQRALDSYRIVDTLPEAAYDDIVALARLICATPVALVSLIDQERQWFKARSGFEPAQTPRDIALCDHAIRAPDLMEVNDARSDPRFMHNPLVTGDAGIRFYAGVPLRTADGDTLGTVCVIDHRPRVLDDAQRTGLRALARLTMRLMEAGKIALAVGRSRQERSFVDAAAARNSAAQATPAAGAVAIVHIDAIAALRAAHGEDAVERALVAIEPRVQATLRPQDIASRYGDQQLLLVLADGSQVADTLARVKALVADAGGFTGATASIGVAVGQAGDGMDVLFLRADDALSSARRQGGGATVIVGG